MSIKNIKLGFFVLFIGVIFGVFDYYVLNDSVITNPVVLSASIKAAWGLFGIIIYKKAKK